MIASRITVTPKCTNFNSSRGIVEFPVGIVAFEYLVADDRKVGKFDGVFVNK